MMGEERVRHRGRTERRRALQQSRERGAQLEFMAGTRSLSQGGRVQNPGEVMRARGKDDQGAEDETWPSALGAFAPRMHGVPHQVFLNLLWIRKNSSAVIIAVSRAATERCTQEICF